MGAYSSADVNGNDDVWDGVLGTACVICAIESEQACAARVAACGRGGYVLHEKGGVARYGEAGLGGRVTRCDPVRCA